VLVEIVDCVNDSRRLSIVMYIVDAYIELIGQFLQELMIKRSRRNNVEFLKILDFIFSLLVLKRVSVSKVFFLKSQLNCGIYTLQCFEYFRA